MQQDRICPGRSTSEDDRAFTAYSRSEEYRLIRNGRLHLYFSNLEDREDCGQLVDLKVYRSLFREANLRPPYAFDAAGRPAAPFVQDVVRNACFDYLRALRRRRVVVGYEMSLDVADANPSSDPAVAADFDRTIYELAGNDESIERDLRLIQLHEAGYTYRDMAKMLYPDDVNPASLELLAERVRHRVRTARIRLGRELL